MTQPTIIFFGTDAPRHKGDIAAPKVYLRTLLFATSKRGRIIESMHVSLTRNETRQNFNVWVYGDQKLVRGSGLFVGEGGVAANHHFLTPKDDSFQFTAGKYRLDVFAKILGETKQTLLFSQSLEITRDVAAQLKQSETGLYFDWGPDSAEYIAHVDKRSSSVETNTFLEALGVNQQPDKRG